MTPPLWKFSENSSDPSLRVCKFFVKYLKLPPIFLQNEKYPLNQTIFATGAQTNKVFNIMYSKMYFFSICVICIRLQNAPTKTQITNLIVSVFVFVLVCVLCLHFFLICIKVKDEKWSWTKFVSHPGGTGVIWERNGGALDGCDTCYCW